MEKTNPSRSHPNWKNFVVFYWESYYENQERTHTEEVEGNNEKLQKDQ